MPKPMQQAIAKSQPVANVRPSSLRGEPQIGFPEGVDLAPRKALIEANFEFLSAAASEDHRAMLVAVNKMLAGAMMACEIQNPFLEAPGLVAVQIAIEDALAGKTPRLFQAVPRTDGKTPPREPGSEWMAVTGILLCAAIAKKLDDKGLEKSLVQVIEDLEKDLGFHVDDCLKPVKAAAKDTDRSRSDNRIANLASRFRRNHTEDLTKENTAAGRSRAGVLYRSGLKSIEEEPVDVIKSRGLYDLTRGTTANLLRYAKAVRENKVRPKGGKGRQLEKYE